MHLSDIVWHPMQPRMLSILWCGKFNCCEQRRGHPHRHPYSRNPPMDCQYHSPANYQPDNITSMTPTVCVYTYCNCTQRTIHSMTLPPHDHNCATHCVPVFSNMQSHTIDTVQCSGRRIFIIIPKNRGSTSANVLTAIDRHGPRSPGPSAKDLDSCHVHLRRHLRLHIVHYFQGWVLHHFWVWLTPQKTTT